MSEIATDTALDQIVARIDRGPQFAYRRGGRVVECGGLENRYRCKPIEGSNPSSSANALFLHVSSCFIVPHIPNKNGRLCFSLSLDVSL